MTSFTRARGFTLIELAIVLLVVSLMVNFGMQAAQVSTATDCYAKTREQMVVIREAVKRFADTNARLPLPAGRSYSVTSPNYGREATSTADTAIDNANNQLYGAVPFQALQLPASYAADCWGNKFSYIVTTNLVTATNYTSYTGSIEVRYGTSATYSQLTQRAGWAVISHGADGKGGVKANYGSASHAWSGQTDSTCSGSASNIDRGNCDVADSILYTNEISNGTGSTAYFDDLVTYGEKLLLQSNMYCWGLDTNGTLGTNNTGAHHYPMPVSGTTQFVSLYASNTTANTLDLCGLTVDGTAYCWGDNASKQIGTYVGTVYTPQNTLSPYKFKSLALGSYVSCGIIRNDGGGSGTDGNVMCWGTASSALGNRGQTGHGANTYASGTPVAIDTTNIVAGSIFANVYVNDTGLACATTSTTLGTSLGAAYCWGNSANGQIGDKGLTITSSTSYYNKPLRVGGPASASPVNVVGTDSAGTTLVFSKLSLQSYSVCGLTTAKKIYCWGANDYGQLARGVIGSGSGYDPANPPTVSIAGGCNSPAAAFTVRVVGTTVVAADVTSGAATTGGGSCTATNPITVTCTAPCTGSNARFTLAPSAGGTSYLAMIPVYQDPTPVEIIDNASGHRTFSALMDVDTEAQFFCAIEDSTNIVFCWGRNNYGQVGNGTASTASTGHGYTSAPAVKIKHNSGTGAVITASAPSGGALTTFTVTSKGSGYNGASTSATAVFSGGDGYGASASVLLGGPITGITVSNTGSGYTSAPTVTISPGGSYGSGASVTATRCTGVNTPVAGCTAANKIAPTLTIVSGGTGYIDGKPTVSFSGGGGSGAAASVNYISGDTVEAVTANADENNQWSAAAVNTAETFSNIRGANGSVFGITTSGSSHANQLYAWGQANGNTLGNNSSTDVTSPTWIQWTVTGDDSNTPDNSAGGISYATVGSGNSVENVLTSDGTAYGWRYSPGNGNSGNTPYPVAVCPSTRPNYSAPSCNYKWLVLLKQKKTTCAIKQ